MSQSEGRLTNREFFKQCSAAVEYMTQFPELTPKRVELQKMLDRAIDSMLIKYYSMNDSYRTLVSMKDDDVEYLSQLLFFGLAVHQGVPYLQAYEETLGPLDSSFTKYFVKRVMRQEYFRKLKDDEYDIINTLFQIHNENGSK